MNQNDIIKIASEAALIAGEEIMNIYNDSEFIDFKKKKIIHRSQKPIELRII